MSATPQGKSPRRRWQTSSVRRDNLQSQITQLQREIAAATKRQQAADPNSSDGKKEAQLLARLRTEQANLSLQLDKVEDKIATGTTRLRP